MVRGLLDRRGEEWPTANLRRDVEFLPHTPTEQAKIDALRRVMMPPPPVTPMGQSMGLDDIARMQEFQNLAAPDLYGSYSGGPIGTRLSMPELDAMLKYLGGFR